MDNVDKQTLLHLLESHQKIADKLSTSEEDPRRRNYAKYAVARDTLRTLAIEMERIVPEVGTALTKLVDTISEA